MKKVHYSPHPVIPRPGARTYNDGKFWHFGTRYCCHELCSVFCDPAPFGFGTNHEAADVLQEDKRYVPLGTELDKMRAFEAGFREKNAVIGNDANRVRMDMGEA